MVNLCELVLRALGSSGRAMGEEPYGSLRTARRALDSLTSAHREDPLSGVANWSTPDRFRGLADGR